MRALPAYKRLAALAAWASVAWLIVLPSALAGKNEAADGIPEFAYPYAGQQEFWINSEPLSVRKLRGKPFMVEFWTFGCINCKRSIPWVKSLKERFSADHFAVIGVHTPEFDHEKSRGAVEKAVERLGITHPVMLDNDFIYWKDMGNRYWPAYYIVDSNGQVVASFVGEVHAGTEKAAKIERLIDSLL
jgi:thiol-disulfide isomerase/thioredoxin